MEEPEGEPEALLGITERLVQESHPGGYRLNITLDSSMEKDLGLDSLSRMELLHRIEEAFGVHLSDRLLVSAETLRDLLGSLGAPATAPSSPPKVTERLPEFAPQEPIGANTLQTVLEWHVARHPDRPHIHLLEEDRETSMSYAELLQAATRVAGGLQERGLLPGQCVGLMLPTSLDYFHAFFGVLLAGGVPVPLYPPIRLSQIEDHLQRQAGILNNSNATFLIAMPEARPLTRLIKSLVESLQEVLTLPDLDASGSVNRLVPRAEDVALLQYTSGSTGSPKGVSLTHANLLSNIRAMGKATRASSADVFVSWLPLYHDMGLIGAWLGSLYFAMPLVLMSPISFLARPERWLWAIHRFRGTLSAAPNFAFELCSTRIDEEHLKGLDLSSWRMALNGAEPVSPSTLDSFCARFNPYGFDSKAMAPVYGLAESSVGLAFPPPGRGPLIDRIRRESLMRDSRALPAEPSDSTALRFVGCGSALPWHQIRIVDEQDREVPEREVGRLQFKGPSCTSGYFRNPEETRRLFHGKWLDSGDLAYIAAGEVYLTGRVKDLIIRGGRNLYPQSLEEEVGTVQGIRRGRVAVFGSKDPESGTERLVVLAETRVRSAKRRVELHREIVEKTLSLLGLPPDDVVLAPPNTILKTSSGKIRRSANRALYESGSFGGKARDVRLQLLRLYLASLLHRWHRLRRRAGQLLFALYAWGIFLLLAIVVWSAVALLPREDWRKVLAQKACRLLLRWCGIPLSVHGREQLDAHGRCLLVSNHASYVDVLALYASLPLDVRFVARRDFLQQFIPGTFLSRLGVRFVDRDDPVQGVADTQRLISEVRNGEALFFFPEGGFWREPGLHPFHLGAFAIAAETNTPVVPIALRGTRSILRPDTWFPFRGAVMLTIGKEIQPRGTDLAAAGRLREEAFAAVLRHCGEPALESGGRA